ncbi:hypothetical protein TRFO_27763 [Tritrichomonas foetus]|uniref:Uncharacterized protein n=1 Tax=Tritrichomonas foetus TaxID=1144522 RepID=A0A1J4K150_9EUKA|nr:hypothetical protein TRFO_27763 [Tritrichomonas foetus]|eukprot:OHT04682.1 hypothetical protein TRFO_27763 [Tritrichomonas foetus]
MDKENTESRKNVPPKKTRGQGSEAQRVNNRLNGFNPEESAVWKEIKQRFSSGITHGELKSIATLICSRLNLKLDRDASRDNRVLIKWFDENWGEIKKIIDQIQIHDENKEPITAERESID